MTRQFVFYGYVGRPVNYNYYSKCFAFSKNESGIPTCFHSSSITTALYPYCSCRARQVSGRNNNGNCDWLDIPNRKHGNAQTRCQPCVRQSTFARTSSSDAKTPIILGTSVALNPADDTALGNVKEIPASGRLN